MYKLTKCLVCREALYSTVPESAEMLQAADFANIKFKGGVNHLNKIVFRSFQDVEKVLVKHIKSLDFFEETLDELFSDSEIVESMNYFPCTVHKGDVTSKGIYFYVYMRVKQYYKQKNKKNKKKHSQQKKLKIV